jgi:hypothetical protein
MASISPHPELKQFGDLTVDDFERHPIWLNCHVVDYDESWYEETDEETFRPWSGPIPVAPESYYLIRADFTAADGSRFAGFLTPCTSDWPYKTTHPHIFVDRHLIGFWEGSTPIVARLRSRLYEGSRKSASQLFPFRACTSPGLIEPAVQDFVEGFYAIARFGEAPTVGH